MLRNKYILLLLIALNSLMLKAQGVDPNVSEADPNLKIGQRYEPIYSQYWVNGLAINPAYTGSRECFSNIILYRNQWMGFEGAPVTQTLSSHAPFKDEKNAAGLFIFHEEIGVTDYFEVYGNYAFRFQLGQGRLSLGLRAGATFFQGNYSDVVAEPEGATDDYLVDESEVFPNAGVGVYYYTDQFFAGLSVPKLLSYEVKNSQKNMSVSPENYDFLFTAGFLYSFSDKVRVRPTALFRYRLNNGLQFDAGAHFIFYDAVWFGGTYRMSNEYSFMAEYQATEQIRAGVAYDIAGGDLAGQHNGSLEIILRYEFKYRIRAVSPRYF
ncbi:MAG: type IX secretion system membrane protein PorP/SprF [Bacteroidetes bacterium]|nr:type IX secretion system membrane protein PorP/SprF [Bacteroidota bacterium]